MDTEAGYATIWLFVAVVVPSALIYGAFFTVGLEPRTLLDAAITTGVVIGSLAWVLYCTWQIRLVSVPPEVDLETPRP